jgi:hypothetical protein
VSVESERVERLTVSDSPGGFRFEDLPAGTDFSSLFDERLAQAERAAPAALGQAGKPTRQTHVVIDPVAVSRPLREVFSITTKGDEGVSMRAEIFAMRPAPPWDTFASRT